MKICLDPGHTKGYNAGVNKNYREGTAMFTLAAKLKAQLECYEGVEVFLTRSLTANPSLDVRANVARKNGCDLLLSLHSNAAANASACGVSVFYSVKRDSEAFAQALSEAVAAVMKQDTAVTYPRGAKTRTYVGKNDGKTYDYYGIIRGAVVGNVVKHALIVEHGFHTNAAECQWLMQDANLDRLAQVDAAVIAKQLGLSPKTAASQPETEKSAFYVGDRVNIRAEATTYGNSTVKIPSWVKQEVHTVAALGTVANNRDKQARLKEINSWVKLSDLVLAKEETPTFEKWDAVKVVGTDRWASGVKMAAFVTAGTVFYVHSVRNGGAVTVIGRKVAGDIAVTGAVESKFLKKV